MRISRSDLAVEPVVLRRILISIAVIFLGLFLVVPLTIVFVQAFSAGWQAYVAAIVDPITLAAIRLTLIVAAIAVPLNTAFGLAAAWAIGKFDFPGKRVLTTIIDLPFAVSPVIAGLAFVLLMGNRGLLGPWLESLGWRVIFAVPGIVLTTLFVTLPFVARELIPLMQAQGVEEEEAALALGASGLADVLASESAQRQMGIALRCRLDERPGDGGVRCGVRGLGSYPRGDQHPAAACGDSLQRV